MTINYQPAIAAGVLAEAEANAIAAAIVDVDGVGYVDLGRLTDDELEALDRFVVWTTMSRAH